MTVDSIVRPEVVVDVDIESVKCCERKFIVGNLRGGEDVVSWCENPAEWAEVNRCCGHRSLVCNPHHIDPDGFLPFVPWSCAGCGRRYNKHADMVCASYRI